MIDKTPYHIPNVQANDWDAGISSNGKDFLALRCRIGDRKFVVPVKLIDPKSEVQRPGDEGTLVIPTWLAEMMGLI